MENILEIIFVSSDRDEEGFEEYFGEMPWLALPYDSKTKKVGTHKRSHNTVVIITARFRSLWEGNVFSYACLLTIGRGGPNVIGHIWDPRTCSSLLTPPLIEKQAVGFPLKVHFLPSNPINNTILQIACLQFLNKNMGYFCLTHGETHCCGPTNTLQRKVVQWQRATFLKRTKSNNDHDHDLIHKTETMLSFQFDSALLTPI